MALVLLPIRGESAVAVAVDSTHRLRHSVPMHVELEGAYTVQAIRMLLRPLHQEFAIAEQCNGFVTLHGDFDTESALAAMFATAVVDGPRTDWASWDGIALFAATSKLSEILRTVAENADASNPNRAVEDFDQIGRRLTPLGRRLSARLGLEAVDLPDARVCGHSGASGECVLAPDTRKEERAAQA